MASLTRCLPRLLQQKQRPPVYPVVSKLLSTAASATVAAEPSSSTADRAASARQAELQLRWQNFPLPKGNLEFRAATLADRAQVLGIEPDIHYGLDYLAEYYDEIVGHDRRCGIVAVDKVNGSILSFGYAILGHDGRSVSYAGGRTLKALRSYGLASVTTGALYELVKPKLHPTACCCGVYSLPGYTRAYCARLRGLVEVVLHNQQLGFECDADYWSALEGRLGESGAEDAVRPVDNPVEFLSSEAVCSGTENRLFKPDQFALVAKEALTLSRGNLLIWEGHLKQVMASQSDSASAAPGEVTGVSIANWNSVPIGGHHLVINIYCRTESCAVSHLTAQLRAASQRLRLSDRLRHRLYISAYVPSHLLYNEVLSGIRIHPLIRDLPQSLSPKLACDVRIGAWSPGSYV